MKLDKEVIPSGLPKDVSTFLRCIGITSLYPVQRQAVEAGLFKGPNFLVCSPTASGKSLIAFMSIVHNLNSGKKSVYLAPLKALASEKYRELKKMLKDANISCKLSITTGDYDNPSNFLAEKDVIIATYEKFDSIFRHQPQWLQDIGLIVLDEIHLLSSLGRGSVIEMLITWIKRAYPQLHILGLSATIKNVEELSGWLKAHPIVSHWRPVPLREAIYVDGKLVFSDEAESDILTTYEDPLLDLADYVLRENGQILFFTPTRRSAESLANKLTKVSYRYLSKRVRSLILRRIKETRSSIERTSLSEKLFSVLERGSAFHHAGLPPACRNLVEELFRNSYLKTLAATPTLAAGVNLPARYVAIVSTRRYDRVFGSTDISVMEYKQMAGRAGRPQYDKYGVAVLIARNTVEARYLMEAYLKSEPEPIVSVLESGEKSVEFYVLASLVAGMGFSKEDLLELFSSTLYAYQFGERNIRDKVFSSLLYLQKEGAITENNGYLKPTSLGRRIAQLYIEPKSAFWFRDFLSSPPSKVTSITLLHMATTSPDMLLVYATKRDRDILEFFIERHKDELPLDLLVERPLFWDEIKTTVTLTYWISEESENFILKNLDVQPGDLYRIVESSEWLIYAAGELAPFFGYDGYLQQLEELRLRVKHGVRKELLPLVSIKGIGRVRARRLFNSGIKTLDDLKRVPIEKIKSIPGFGSSLALSIKREVGGKVPKISEKRETIQKPITDYLVEDEDSSN